MDLTTHLSVIFQRKWQVLAAALLIAGAVYAWRSSAPNTYAANSLLYVTSSRAISGDPVTEQDALFLGQGYATMAMTRPVVQDAIDRSKLRLDVQEAERRLSVDAGQPGYLQVRATGPDRRDAATLSQALADSVIAAVATRQSEQLDRQLQPVQSQIAGVEAQLNRLSESDPKRRALELQYEALLQNATETRLRPVDRLSVVTPARAQADPVAPRPRRDALLALLVALVVNAELAVALSALSGRFSSANAAEQVARVTGLPILAEVPPGGRRNEGQVVEAFRTLRTNLLFVRGEGELHSIAVVGGDPGSGKTFVAEHLCRALARPGSPVLIVDGDLRNPTLHTRLGVEIGPGVADALAPPFQFSKPAEVDGQRNLRVLPAGRPTGDPAALFTGKTFVRFLERVRPLGLIVVDTPPLSLFADAAAVAQNCDATVLVIDIKKARRRDVERMIESLNQVGVVPLGVVLNRMATVKARNYGDYRDSSRRTHLAATGTSDE